MSYFVLLLIKALHTLSSFLIVSYSYLILCVFVFLWCFWTVHIYLTYFAATLFVIVQVWAL